MRTAVIVGAGLIGLTCARELLRAGMAVTLIDREEPGQGCSGGNSGFVTPSFSGPLPAPGLVRTSLAWLLRRDSPLYIRPRALPGLVPWLWSFARHCNRDAYLAGLRAVAGLARPTMSLFDDLVEDGLTFEMHRQGLLFAFETRSALVHTLADLRLLHEFGYAQPQPLSAAELHTLEPAVGPPLTAGIFVDGERNIRSECLAAALVAWLRARGAVFVRAEVDGFAHAGSVVRAATAGGQSIAADCFLVAAGALSGVVARSLGYRLPVQAGTGYSVTVRQPAVRLRQPLYLEEAKVACSPFRDALRLAGTMELSGLDPSLDASRLQVLRGALSRLLPGWDQGEAIRPWAGMRPLTPDGLPVIGSVPGYTNAFVATGHGMLGVTLAPVTARAIAELVCGLPPTVDLAAFTPARFGGRGARPTPSTRPA